MKKQDFDLSSWELSPAEKLEHLADSTSNIHLGFIDKLNSNLPFLPPPPEFEDHLPQEDQLWKRQQQWFEDQIQLRNLQELEFQEQMRLVTQQFISQDQLSPSSVFRDALEPDNPIFPPFEFNDTDTADADYELQQQNQDFNSVNVHDGSYIELIDSLDGFGENILDWKTYERATNELWNLRSTVRSRSASDLLEKFKCERRIPRPQVIKTRNCDYKYNDPYDASCGEEMEDDDDESDAERRPLHRTRERTTVHTTVSSASSLTSVRVLVSQSQETQDIKISGGAEVPNRGSGRNLSNCPCYECRRRKPVALTSSQSLAELDMEINYIQKNIKDLKKYKKPAPLEPKLIAVTHKGHTKPPLPRLMDKPGFGKVPDYIIKRKEEMIKAKEDAAKEAANRARQRAEERRKEKKLQVLLSATPNPKPLPKKNGNKNDKDKSKQRLKKQLNLVVSALDSKKGKTREGLSTPGNSVFVARYKSPPDLRAYPFAFDLTKLSGPKDKNNNNPTKFVAEWMTKNNTNNIKPPQFNPQPENIMMKIVLKKEEMPDSEIFSNLQSIAQLRKGTLSAPARSYPPIVSDPPEPEPIGASVHVVSSTPLPQSQLPNEIDSAELIHLVNNNYGYDFY